MAWRYGLVGVVAMAGCSILGSVEGDYRLAGDGGVGGAEPMGGAGGQAGNQVGGGGAGGGVDCGEELTPEPFLVHVQSSIDASVIDVVVHDDAIYAVGYFNGDGLYVDDMQVFVGTSELQAAFILKFSPDGSLEDSQVFDGEGIDRLHDVAVLDDGELVVAGECCGLEGYEQSLPCPNVGEVFGCVAQLYPNLTARNAMRFGEEPSYAAGMTVVGGEILVTAEVVLNGSMQVSDCDVPPAMGFGPAESSAMALLRLAPETLACTSTIYFWDDVSSLNDHIVDAEGRHIVLGSYSGAPALVSETGAQDFLATRINAGDDTLQLITARSPQMSAAVDAAFVVDGDIIISGQVGTGAVIGGENALGASNASVSRVEDDGTHVWTTLLSDNGSSVASATTVATCGSRVVTAGNFLGDSRGFGLEDPISAVGTTDMFIATLSADSGEVLSVSQLGASGVSVFAAAMAWLDGDVVLTGQFDGDIGTDDGTLYCQATGSCGFILRAAIP